MYLLNLVTLVFKDTVNKYPYLSEDITCRLELLTVKWDILASHGFANIFDSSGKPTPKKLRLSGRHQD